MLKKETNWRVSVVLTAAQVQLVLDPNICLQEAVFFFLLLMMGFTAQIPWQDPQHRWAGLPGTNMSARP